MRSSSGRTICKLLHCEEKPCEEKPCEEKPCQEKPCQQKPCKPIASFNKLFKDFRKETRELYGNRDYQYTTKDDSGESPHRATLEFYDGKNVNSDVSGVFFMVLVDKNEIKIDLIVGEYELVAEDIILLNGYSHGTIHHHIYALEFDDSDECDIHLIKTAPVKGDKRLPIKSESNKESDESEPASVPEPEYGNRTKSRWGGFINAVDKAADSVAKVAKSVAKTVEKVADDIADLVEDAWKAIVNSVLNPLLEDAVSVFTLCNSSDLDILANATTIAAYLKTGTPLGLEVALAECLTDYMIGNHSELQAVNETIQTFIAVAMTAADFQGGFLAITAIADAVSITAAIVSTIDSVNASEKQ